MLKKFLALVLAGAMVLGSVSMAYASETNDPPTGDTGSGTGETGGETGGAGAAVTAPTKGSITINSPVVKATYDLYKIFDETTNIAEDAFSYTIDTTNPYYGAVVAYAAEKSNGLILTRIQGSDPAKYNVSAVTEKNPVTGYSNFDPQKFGKKMLDVLTTEGSPAVTADAAYTTDSKDGIAPKDAVAAGVANFPKADSKVATITADNTSGQLKFTDLPLGYYLINPTYPTVNPLTVKLGEGTQNEVEFTDADLVQDADGVVIPRALTDAAKAKITTFVEATVDVDKYIADHGIKTNKDGTPLNDAGKAQYKAELIQKMQADAEAQILDKFNNNPHEADINVKEPILIFLDSAKPDAVINEKNETVKWDVPVNPTGDVKPGTPDHGEPEGGKNIVVQEDPAYYADWSEAEIGESVHYQLRVNAMNFVTKDLTTEDNIDNPTVNQVKEYFIADYQSAQMHFDESKGLKVTIWQGDNDNDSQANTAVNVTQEVVYNADGTATVTTPADGYLDYTDKATGTNQVFFMNKGNSDGNFTATGDIFGTDGKGIMIPWVIVSKDETLKDTYPIYETTTVPKFEADGTTKVYKTEGFKLDDNGDKIPVKEQNASGDWVVVDGQFVSEYNHVVNAQGQLLDANGDPIQDTEDIYTYSIYKSDVTIVVDYWMILDDDAIVDEPGNKNFAQFGWNPIDNKNTDGTPKTPTNPNEETDKPSQKERVDEATVYTFAIAWVKVDEQGNELAGAEFELPFFVKATKDKDTYVYLVSKKAIEAAEKAVTDAGEDADALAAAQAELARLNGLKDDGTDKVTTTTSSAVITIKGVEQAVYTITETKAPAGYNLLIAPFTVEAKKSGPTVTTKTKTIIYLDADGNVTDEVTTATTEYETDEDSFNNENQTAAGEEKTVPVYQFDPIVNLQGTELPSTGGVGTTLFYAGGAILVLLAGVLLVSKRRFA